MKIFIQTGSCFPAIIVNLFLLMPVLSVAQLALPQLALQQDSILQYIKRAEGKPFTPNFPGYSNAGSVLSIAGNNITSCPERPAGLGQCRDTSSRIAVIKDSMYIYTRFNSFTKDGNILVSGECIDIRIAPSKSRGFLIKMNPYGQVLWSKMYDSINHQKSHYINFYQNKELKDGSILLAGATYDAGTGNDDIIIARVDASGNIIWVKDFYSRIWTNGSGSADAFFIHQLKEDTATGDIFLVSPSWANGLYVLRLDVSNGNVVWSNMYKLNNGGYNNERPAGLLIKPDELLVVGSQTVTSTDLLFYRIDKNTGDTLGTRILLQQDTPYTKKALLSIFEMREMDDGRIAVPATQYGYSQYLYNGVVPLYHAAVLMINRDLSFNKGFCFRNKIESNNYNTRVTVHPDGSGLFSMLHYYSSYTSDVHYVQFDSTGQILKQRLKHYSGQGIPFEPYSLPLPGSGDMIVQLMGDTIQHNSPIVISKLHLTDTSSDCMGRDMPLTFTEPLHYRGTFYARLDSFRRNVILERRVRNIQTLPLVLSPAIPYCEQVSYCDTLHLTASDDTTCPQTPVFIKVHVNPACGGKPVFSFDTSAVSIFEAINDSTYKVIFRKSWSGNIKASLAGCTVLTDSLPFVVLDAPGSLQLGADTTICPGNSFQLHAGTGFASYRWQDGSRDSLFTVTTPGRYYVTAYNACGGSLSDTIIVTAHTPAAFSLGQDKTICKDSIVMITAPAGFLSYQWTSYGTITTPDAASIRVKPATTTDYMVRAEDKPGCFVFDTIRVWVNPVPLVYIGRDTSFCKGDSLIINAGAGFSHYHWSTGDTGVVITAKLSGSYAVTVSNSAGCIGADTVSVIQVYALPAVNLGNDTVLCAGTNRILDAGVFDRYLWNTGNSTRTITVMDTGFYSLQVTDDNQCTGKGSLHISRLVIPPSAFLRPDTAICSYDKIVLAAPAGYRSYWWNTGVQANAITVVEPGSYWLAVTDIYNCAGRDTVNITPANDCMRGLYVPRAFSPNGDGLNDLFRPLIYGSVQYFEWSIYNRYGQLIYNSAAVTESWDGTFKGRAQPSGTYTWVCRYKLAGKNDVLKKGVVLLLR